MTLSEEIEAEYQARKAAAGPLEANMPTVGPFVYRVRALEANQRTGRDDENERLRQAFEHEWGEQIGDTPEMLRMRDAIEEHS